jgi:CubicO group peptidase (beta-lactamase class C family)
MLLTHTGGFPTAPLGPPNWIDRDWRVQQMARWRLNWEPGTRFEYHPTSAHWVLGEIIARLDGVDTTESVRRRILEPLGLTRLAFGVPAADQGDIADLVLGGSPLSQAELEATFGPGFSLGEVTPEVLLGFNEPTAREVGMPGGGAVSDAADLAMYYQALLHNTKGLWNAEMLSDGTGNIRCVLPDPLTGVPANRTLGLVVAGDDGKSAFRGFGHTVGPRTFGHNGAAGQIAFADPDTGMSFVYLTNGIDQDFLREARRGVSLASRAGRLLSLDE